MSNDWLANKMTMLAKEVERNKNDEFMLLELEDKQIKEKDVVLFKQNKWSESKLDLLNELANKFLNRVSIESLKILNQI